MIMIQCRALFLTMLGHLAEDCNITYATAAASITLLMLLNIVYIFCICVLCYKRRQHALTENKNPNYPYEITTLKNIDTDPNNDIPLEQNSSYQKPVINRAVFT